MGAARIDHEYELRRADDNSLLATAQTTIASVAADGQVIAIPDWIRA